MGKYAQTLSNVDKAISLGEMQMKDYEGIDCLVMMSILQPWIHPPCLKYKMFFIKYKLLEINYLQQKVRYRCVLIILAIFVAMYCLFTICFTIENPLL